MNIIGRLTIQNLKKNRKRTVVTILGVIISTAMITAVSTFSGSFLDIMQRDEINQEGDWHYKYVNVARDQIDQIQSDDSLADSGLSHTIGHALLEGSVELDDPRIQLVSLDDKSFQLKNVQLTEGRFPESSNELILLEKTFTKNKKPIQVGESIRVQVAHAFDEENKNRDNSNYLYDGIELRPDGEKAYQVVGLVKRFGNAIPAYSYPAYTKLTSSSEFDFYDIFAKQKEVTASIYDHVPHQELAQEISYHSSLLRYMGLFEDETFTRTLSVLACIVLGVIIIGSVMLIYNAFAISISERSRQLGMLSSVGATRSQKRNSVLFEGFIIGVIAIPLGIFFGILGIGITFAIVSPLVQNSLGVTVPFQLVVLPSAMIGAVLLSVFTIFISAFIPAFRASKISPIEAIRQSRDIKLKSRQLKTSIITKKIFGFEGELALKNLKRNRKRYRSTILSLSVSIILFLTASSFSNYLRASVNMTDSGIGFNVSASAYGDNKEMESMKNDLLKEFADHSDIDTLTITRSTYLQTIQPSDKITDSIREKMGEQSDYVFTAAITELNTAAMKEYAKQVGVEYSTLIDKENPHGILVNDITLRQGYVFSEETILKVKPEESLILTDGASYESAIKLAALTKEPPLSISSKTISPDLLNIIVSEEVFDSLDLASIISETRTQYRVAVKTSQSEQVVKNFEKFFLQHTDVESSIQNIDDATRRDTQMFQLMSIFLYGFVILITLISVANIFNTISTSIGLRKREFAMLKSVGMTPPAFNKMLNFESLFYGLKSLLFGIPISMVIMILLFAGLQENFSFGFFVPWGSIILAVVAVFFIVGITMLYSSSKVKKANIVDALTEENL